MSGFFRPALPFPSVEFCIRQHAAISEQKFSPRKERNLFIHFYNAESNFGFNKGRNHYITLLQCFLSLHCIFKKYFHRRPDTHLQSLCIYFLLRTHIIKLKVNSMKIISTITVVANLSLAGVNVARQSEAITSLISSTWVGLMYSGPRVSRSLQT